MWPMVLQWLHGLVGRPGLSSARVSRAMFANLLTTSSTLSSIRRITLARWSSTSCFVGVVGALAEMGWSVAVGTGAGAVPAAIVGLGAAGAGFGWYVTIAVVVAGYVVVAIVGWLGAAVVMACVVGTLGVVSVCVGCCMRWGNAMTWSCAAFMAFFKDW